MVEPGRFHFLLLARFGRAGTEEVHLTYSLVAFRLAAESQRREFAPIAARFTQQGNRDPLAFRHSRISSVNRRFSFIPAAPRMVRIERAVRPCLPMTFPRSLGATFSSRTVTCSPCTIWTETSSGMSTRAFAISSINCFIQPRLPLIMVPERGVRNDLTSRIQVILLTVRRL